MLKSILKIVVIVVTAVIKIGSVIEERRRTG